AATRSDHGYYQGAQILLKCRANILWTSSLMEIKPEFYCRFQLNRYFCSQPTSLMNYSTILLKAIPYKKLLTRLFMLILPISAISCQSDSERRPNVENIDVNV